MKKHVPNCITLLNLLCGCIAVIFAVKNQLQWAGLFVALGIFFDFFDGFFARLLHVKSDLGLQLDSLADMVTSGLTPGIVMFQLLSYSHFVEENTSLTTTLLPYFGLIITLASAYRLANFNIDSRQTTGFIGLPTPANALFILSLPLILLYQNSTFSIFT
ncbi:Phosphatidylserine synthase (fragment) [Capnocytophaga canimorsus]